MSHLWQVTITYNQRGPAVDLVRTLEAQATSCATTNPPAEYCGVCPITVSIDIVETDDQQVAQR